MRCWGHNSIVLGLLLIVAACTGGGHRYHTIGDIKEEVIYYPPPHEIEEQARGVLRSSSEKQRKIALLLPLSGRYAELGQSLFHAAELALFDFGRSNVVLMPFDTQGTAFGAVKAAKEMLTYNIDLVLGPVFSESAIAVAGLPQEQRVPMISFSNNRKLTEHGIYIMGWLPDQQVKRVVQYALQEGIKEYSAILPNTHLGAEAAKELRETIAPDPESVVLKSEFYRLNRSAQPVRLSRHVFSAYDATLNQRSPLDYDEELEAYNEDPIDYPRALLIPEGKSRLQAVLRVLKRYHFDKEKVQLLGSSQWFDEALLQDPLVDGAWFAFPPREKKQQFEARYQTIYHKKPAAIANLSYDAVALAVTLAHLAKQDQAPYATEVLTNPRGFVGTEGVFRFMENGLVERGLAVYQIQEGKFVIKDQAPRNFYKVISTSTITKEAEEKPAEKPVENVDQVEQNSVESEENSGDTLD